MKKTVKSHKLTEEGNNFCFILKFRTVADVAKMTNIRNLLKKNFIKPNLMKPINLKYMYSLIVLNMYQNKQLSRVENILFFVDIL